MSQNGDLIDHLWIKKGLLHNLARHGSQSKRKLGAMRYNRHQTGMEISDV